MGHVTSVRGEASMKASARWHNGSGGNSASFPFKKIRTELLYYTSYAIKSKFCFIYDKCQKIKFYSVCPHFHMFKVRSETKAKIVEQAKKNLKSGKPKKKLQT